MVFKDMILYEQKRLSSIDCGECVAIIMSRMSLYSLFLHKTILVAAGNRQQTNERYAHDTNILFHDDLILMMPTLLAFRLPPSMIEYFLFLTFSRRIQHSNVTGDNKRIVNFNLNTVFATPIG